MISPLRRVILLASLGCAGCGLIAGVEDGKLAPDGGSQSSSGSGGSTTSSTGPSSASASSSGTGGACSCDYAAVVKMDQPIAYWRLGDPAMSATAKDEMGAHEGAANSGVTFAKAGAFPCDEDKAASFKATGAVTVPDAPDLDFTGSYALEAWVKVPTGGGGTIAGKSRYAAPDGGTKQYSGYFLATNFDPFEIDFIRGNGMSGGVGTLPFETDYETWLHVVAQYNGATKYLTVNDAEPKSEDDLHAALDLDEPFVIGDSNWGNFDGLIDEVAIYDHMLAPERVTAHYQACKP